MKFNKKNLQIDIRLFHLGSIASLSWSYILFLILAELAKSWGISNSRSLDNQQLWNFFLTDCITTSFSSHDHTLSNFIASNAFLLLISRLSECQYISCINCWQCIILSLHVFSIMQHVEKSKYQISFSSLSRPLSFSLLIETLTAAAKFSLVILLSMH